MRRQHLRVVQHSGRSFACRRRLIAALSMGALLTAIEFIEAPLPVLAAGYSAQVLADGAVAYYRLGETSGTNVVDSSGNGHTGTYSGGYTQGQTGPLTGDATSATLFDGSTGDVTNNDAALTGSFATISLEAWVKTSATIASNPRIIDDGAVYSTKAGYEFMFDPGGGIGFYVGNGTVACWAQSPDGARYNNGNWHYFVATYDGSACRVYADGVMVGQTFSSTSVAAGGWALNIARRSGNGTGDYLNATIGDVAIYSKALTASQIANHRALGVAPVSMPTPAGPSAAPTSTPISSGASLDAPPARTPLASVPTPAAILRPSGGVSIASADVPVDRTRSFASYTPDTDIGLIAGLSLTSHPVVWALVFALVTVSFSIAVHRKAETLIQFVAEDSA